MPASALHAGDRRVRAQVKAADASPLRRLAAAAATANSALLFFILDRSVSPLRPPSALCATRTSTRYTLPADSRETLKPAGPAQDRSRRGRQPIDRATVRGQPETCYMVRWAAPRLSDHLRVALLRSVSQNTRRQTPPPAPPPGQASARMGGLGSGGGPATLPSFAVGRWRWRLGLRRRTATSESLMWPESESDTGQAG